MIFQTLQDRAVVRRPSGRARRGQPLQRAPHALEIADPLLDDFDLLSGFPLDDIAGGAVPDAQPEQLLNLLQRKTELLGVLDEAEARSEEHTSELQSQSNLVCRLLLEKKKKKKYRKLQIRT